MSGSLTAASDYWLGLDLGGTKIAAGVLAMPQGELRQLAQIQTGETRDRAALRAKCLAQLHTLMDWSETHGAVVRGIGVGVAELVDPAGIIRSAATFPWQGVNLAGEFSALAPTVVEADVRAAALAEAQFGAGSGFSTFAYITVGTGISACLVQNGVPYAGARGNALLLGSSILHRDPDLILERIASGAGLVRRFNEISGQRVSSAQAVIAAMHQGDANARHVVESAADALGLGIALYVNLLDPAAVIIGGGLGSAAGIYWERAITAARMLIWADNARELPILHAELGGNSGVIGAALLAYQRFHT